MAMTDTVPSAKCHGGLMFHKRFWKKPAPLEKASASDLSLGCCGKAGGNGSQFGFNGRAISIRLGEIVKLIGIDGSSEGIQEAIKSTFNLRSKRLFWLEGEQGIIRFPDRNMPLGAYSLHLDDGVTIRICNNEDPNHIQCQVTEKTFYHQADLHEYLSRCGWVALKESGRLTNVDSIDDLLIGELYHGFKVQEN